MPFVAIQAILPPAEKYYSIEAARGSFLEQVLLCPGGGRVAWAMRGLAAGDLPPRPSARRASGDLQGCNC